MSVPVVAYGILHQPRHGVEAEAYETNLRALHAGIADEASTMAAEQRRLRSDMVDREASFLRGALAQYLQTPLRSDEQEVRRLLEEAVGRPMSRVLTDDGSVLISTSARRVLPPPAGRGPERRLLAAGRSFLDAQGFTAARGEGAVYESLFIVKGGAALDVLEEIVRDRLGISVPPHGVHLSYFGRSTYALHNLVVVRDPAPSAPGEEEAVFLLEKPGTGYGEFREAIAVLMDRLAAELSPGRAELWQRKLGLGAGTEFILRVRCGPDQAAAVAAWVAAADPGGPSGAALVKGSSCLLTTILHSRP